MTQEQLENAIRLDIQAQIVGDNWEPLLSYQYAKDDLHQLVMEKIDAGQTIADSVDLTLSDWPDAITKDDLTNNRDIFVTRYEEYA